MKDLLWEKNGETSFVMKTKVIFLFVCLYIYFFPLINEGKFSSHFFF